jgi:hypothetical protein
MAGFIASSVPTKRSHAAYTLPPPSARVWPLTRQREHASIFEVCSAPDRERDRNPASGGDLEALTVTVRAVPRA